MSRTAKLEKCYTDEMRPYDFDEFLKQIEDLSLHEMILAANARCAALERGSYGIRGAVKRRELGSTKLADKIKGLLFWLQNGMKPAGLSDSDFRLLRPICVKLIEKKQLKEEALELFD